MRYTAFTALVVAATYLVCWGHWRSVDAAAAHLPPAAAAPSSGGGGGGGGGGGRNPWMLHRTPPTKPESQHNNNFTDDTRPHMCIPEHKYAGLSAAIHRLEEELKIVTNLTFINAGNHTIPTTTYEGFTQQLSLIKDILRNIDDEKRPNANPMPNLRHINFTDLLPLLPKWERTVTENATNSSKNVSSEAFEQVLDYDQRYHHQANIFLHMLIEFLLNLQENFENLLDYVDNFSHKNPTIRQNQPISDEKLEQMELRFEHFASSILQKISELEGKLQLADERQTSQKTSPPEKHEDTVIKTQSVASPVWKDHVTHNTSLSGIEDKLDVLHEKFINFAKDTEERLEALEARPHTSGPPSITGKQPIFSLSLPPHLNPNIPPSFSSILPPSLYISPSLPLSPPSLSLSPSFLPISLLHHSLYPSILSFLPLSPLSHSLFHHSLPPSLSPLPTSV